jgi:hypothetical protein
MSIHRNSPILPAALAVSALLPVAGGMVTPVPAQAGPVLCNTTLEAPQPGTGATGPVEVTRCGVVRTVPDLVQRRYFSYRSPFARGVDLTHQITDILGIAMGGGDGTKVMGLGFPDQAIVWDGSAVENTTNVLLENQSDPIPLRTADLPSCFGTSLAGTACGSAPSPGVLQPEAAPYESQPNYDPGMGTWSGNVRGLW